MQAQTMLISALVGICWKACVPVHKMVHLKHTSFWDMKHAYHLQAHCHAGLVSCYCQSALTRWKCCLQGCRALCTMQKHHWACLLCSRRCLWHCPRSAQAVELMCNLCCKHLPRYLRSENTAEQRVCGCKQWLLHLPYICHATHGIGKLRTNFCRRLC